MPRFFRTRRYAVGGEHDCCPRLQALLQRAFFVECEPQKAGRKQQLVLTEPAQIGRVFDALGYDCKSHITYHINRNLLEEDCCIASFLRGAFLMGGTVAGPGQEKPSRAENHPPESVG